MQVIIDGKTYRCEKGEYILQVARRNKIYIPTLCHNDALSGLGSCRLCVVEVVDRGKSKVVTSCIFPISSEVEVITNSKKIQKIREDLLTLLQARCPENEQIKSLGKSFGIKEARVKRFKLDKTENCVICGLCVKACEEMGIGSISTIDRGIFKAVSTPYGEPSPKCIGCATCATVCPTNAISVVDKDGEREIWGKKFKLEKCGKCGKEIATEEHLKFASARGTLNLGEILCEKCRRKLSAHRMKNTFFNV